MKFGLKIIGQLPQISAPIFKNVSEKKMAKLTGERIASNDLNMIARTIKNQLLLVSCSCFDEKPNSNSYRLFQPFIMFQTVKTTKTKVSSLSKTVRID